MQGPDPARLVALQEECPQEKDFDEEDEYGEALGEWNGRWEALPWSPERTVGAVVLSHLGCACRQWLVVGGPEHGRIWSDDRADDRDLEPLLGAGQEPTAFALRYRERLADAARTVEAAR
ncbi:hypothetical protein [Kitasatospora purpeofusca]|uniref:hypothetical protein n=1 Tax=Kitasatospora purpeofusca TaxID=67352 RepID=UPI003819BED6